MFRHLTLALISVSLSAVPAFGDEEVQAVPPTVAPPTEVNQITAPPTSEEATSNEPDEGRHEAIFARLKELIKRVDALNHAGSKFPSKTIEHALRTEFMRHADGKKEITWHPRKQLSDADVAIALENFELLLGYAEKLVDLARKRRQGKKSDTEDRELRLLAVKSVIDQWNSRKGGNRMPASAGEETGPVGRMEIQRRKRLLAGLAAGDNYVGIPVKKIDDYGKKYKDALSTAAKEFEKFATAINKSAKGRR